MKWNYRVMVQFCLDGPDFRVHEVYYEGDKPVSYTDNPITPGSFYLDGVRWNLEKMIECLGKPVLYYGDKFPEEYES